MIDNIARLGFWMTLTLAVPAVMGIVVWVLIWHLGVVLEPELMPPLGNPLEWITKGFVTCVGLEFFFLSLGAFAHLRPHPEV